MSATDCIEIETGPNPVGSVIWLHGLGADGHDFEPVVPELSLPAELPLRFLFPHAPRRPVTVNGGMVMRAWFDIRSFDREGVQDVEGMHGSRDRLNAMVEAEAERGIDPTRIVVAGFSQGGAVALYTALGRGGRLAGLMGLSTWLPGATALQSLAGSRRLATDTPVLLAHGELDPVLPIALGEETRSVLNQLGYSVEWYRYPMAHSVCAEEIAHIRAWLLRVFGC